MVNISAISATLSSLVSAKNILQSMIGLRDAAAFQEKRLELQGKIMDAQSHVFEVNEERTTLIERVRDLEKQIAEFETWEAEKHRYELKQVSSLGGFAYILKQGMDNSEPIHCLCANCYQNHKKRFLQATENMVSRRRIFRCSDCHASIPLDMDIFNAST